MRKNSIGQKPDTPDILFTKEKNRVGFSRLSGRPCEVIESECLNVPCLPENQQVKLSCCLCELSTGRAHDVEKPNVSQVSEGFRPQFIQLVRPQIINMASHVDISISSLHQSPTLATPETEIKFTKRYKRLKVLDSDI